MASNAKGVIIASVPYPSLKEASRKTGIPYHIITDRLYRGYSLKDAFSKRSYKNDLSITVGNKKFSSFSKAALYFNIDAETARKRISRGWTVEEAFKKARTANGKGVVYKLTNICNNKVYIGITSQNLSNRFAVHKYQSKFLERKSKICVAFRKFGPDSFFIEKLAEAETKDKLLRLEKKFIKQFNSIKFGYNSKR